jgi:lipopolysaccharide heptosyltransferase I
MRILIVKLSSIGDVVHTLPAAALLRRALPDARISWIVERRASAILKDSPVIDNLIEIDTRAWRARASSRATRTDARSKLAQMQEPDRVDIAIDFQGLIKSGAVARMSGAPVRIGFESPDLRERASRFFLTEQVETASCSHVIDKNLKLAGAAVAHRTQQSSQHCAIDYEFPISVSDEDDLYIQHATQAQGRFAVINPGGGWPTKLWSRERYGTIASWLWSEFGIASIVTYGPGEESLARSVTESARCDKVRPLDTTLKQFVALARRACLFVGGDSGPLHLATAAGTPIVGIYGPTSAERNGPFRSSDITVGRNLWCRAECHRRSCWHWECMDIPLDAVKEAVSRRLSSDQREMSA